MAVKGFTLSAVATGFLNGGEVRDAISYFLIVLLLRLAGYEKLSRLRREIEFHPSVRRRDIPVALLTHVPYSLVVLLPRLVGYEDQSLFFSALRATKSCLGFAKISISVLRSVNATSVSHFCPPFLPLVR